MSTITFDTLALVAQLRSAGIPQEQAEAVVKVIAASQGSLATDAKLDSALAPVRTDLAVLKWMLGVILAGVVSLVMKSFL